MYNSTANVWTLIQLPNLPVWTPAGPWPLTPGSAGYHLTFGLAGGATWTSPANDTWQSGNFPCAVGQSNFAASPVNSYIDFAFVQHEPGPVCSTLMDKPFTQNYDECLRYYAKSYPYTTIAGTASINGYDTFFFPLAPLLLSLEALLNIRNQMAKLPTTTLYSYPGVVNAVTAITNLTALVRFGY